ncbi:uncharacterized protein [Littorina saxatilis]|uniref:uncharacterized protein isoform X2 n=1 Tax=Littorina saxatilis TaxID=31220 RepID=UPI0038B678F1
MANQAEDDCHLDNKSVSENADGVFASFKSEESDDAMVGAASGVSPWAKTANHRDGTGSSASAAASRLAAAVFDVRHSDGPGLLCPKDTDHTHPLLDGLPFHFGPKSNTPRRSLTLRERVRVIELYRAGNSIRKIADDFGVGKTQIQTTLKKRNEYLTDFANEVSGESRRRTRKSPYDQINDVCMEWFRDCTLEGLRVTGAMVQEKALQLAGQFGIHDFKASNGWLDSFLKRSGIRTTTPTKEARKNVHALSTSTLLSLRQTLGIDTDVNETESSKHPSLEYSSDDSSTEGCEMVPSGFDNHSTAVAASSHLRRLSTDTRHSHSADSQSGSMPVQPDLGMENASFHDVDQKSSVKVKTEPFDTYTIKKESVEDVSAVESSEEIGSVTLPTSSCHETGMTDNPSITSEGEDNEFNHSKKTTCVLDNLLAQSLQKGLPAQGNQCDKIPERQESQEIYLCHVSLPAHNSNLVSNMASSECSSHIRTSDVLAVWHDSVRPGSGWDMHHGDQLVSTMYQLWQDGRHLDLQLDVNGIIVFTSWWC